MEQTILVTGGAGFIGSHTVVQLLEAGFRVSVIDNLDNSVAEAVDRVRDLVGPKLSQKLHFQLGDLRNKDDLEKLFSQTKFDAVIHFAGLKAVGESVAHPHRYYDNNLVGTINLYAVMAKYNCKKVCFCFLSSAVEPQIRLRYFVSRMLGSVYNQPQETNGTWIDR